MEKDTLIIMIMCYYYGNLLNMIFTDDEKSNDYEKYKRLKLLCKEFKNKNFDNEDYDLQETVEIFLKKKIERSILK